MSTTRTASVSPAAQTAQELPQKAPVAASKASQKQQSPPAKLNPLHSKLGVKAMKPTKKPMLSRDAVTLALAAELHCSKLAAAKALSALISIVKSRVAAGHRVELRGFCVFESSVRAAHRGRNPRTGATVDVPAKRRVKATASPQFLVVRAKRTAKAAK